MELTVERVNPSGKSFLSGGNIYKKGKGLHLASFNGLQGQRVSIEVDGDGWVTNLTKTGGTTTAEAVSVTTEAKTVVAPTSTTSSRSYQRDPEMQIQINRSTAVKAVLDSPSLALIVQNMDLSEGIGQLKDFTLQVANYIQTGSFTQETK